jgi:putative phage-type endonuclease
METKDIFLILNDFNFKRSDPIPDEDELESIIDTITEITEYSEEVVELNVLNYFNEIILTEEDIKRNHEIIKKLDAAPQPEQRSPEWFAMRETMITASDMATAIEENPYQRPLDLIKKKCHITGYQPNKFTEWGVKYEPVADLVYKYLIGEEIKEYGLLKHDTISMIGASPDGITPSGIMVEIKCPFSRKISGIVPHYYWIQIQIQLEVCDLQWCHFEECGLSEYDSEEDFILDSNQEGKPYLTIDNKNKGIVVVACDDNLNKLEYFYSEITLSYEDLKKWTDDKIDQICDDVNLSYLRTTYWKLDTFSCVKVERDREWFQEVLPKIYKFWDKLTFYKENHYELVDLINEKKFNKYMFLDREEKPKKKKNYNQHLESCLFLEDKEHDKKVYDLQPLNKNIPKQECLFLEDKEYEKKIITKSNIIKTETKNKTEYLFID